LQRQLSAIENDLASSRDYYNAVVRDYNTLVETVPLSLLARVGGFRRSQFFGATPEARELPQVRLS
jgi:LemA protein